MRTIATTVLLFLLAGCASKPELIPMDENTLRLWPHTHINRTQFPLDIPLQPYQITAIQESHRQWDQQVAVPDEKRLLCVATILTTDWVEDVCVISPPDSESLTRYICHRAGCYYEADSGIEQTLHWVLTCPTPRETDEISVPSHSERGRNE